MHALGDALVHLADRHGALRGTMKQAAELSNVTRDRLYDNRAVVLNHKAQAITSVDAEVFPHFLRYSDLALLVRVAVGMMLLTLFENLTHM